MLPCPRRDPSDKPRFDGLYAKFAAREKTRLYPFFLDGVFGNPALIHSDGEPPNAAGSDHIAARMTPMVERELGALGRPRFRGRPPGRR
jgi:acyl-CoA thioesterase-1